MQVILAFPKVPSQILQVPYTHFQRDISIIMIISYIQHNAVITEDGMKIFYHKNVIQQPNE